MSALEIMDPKIDSSIVCRYYSVDEAIEDGVAPIPLNMNRTVDVHYIVNFMDHLLSCEVWSNWMTETSLNIINPRIYTDISSVTRFIHIALLCIQENLTERPPMEEVIDILLGSSPIQLSILNEPTWEIKKKFDVFCSILIRI